MLALVNATIVNIATIVVIKGLVFTPGIHCSFMLYIVDKPIYESSEAYTHPHSGVVHSAEFVVDGIARNAVRDNNFCSQEVW